MRDAELASKVWPEKINDKIILHQTLNYSQSEIGIRHPKNPVGVVCRDSAILDIYAGPSRIWAMAEGHIGIKSNSFGVNSGRVGLFIPHINNFTINSKHINEKVFDGGLITRTKVALDTFHVITPSTVVVNGKLVGTKSLSEILAAEPLFVSTPPDEIIRTPEQEVSAILDGFFKGI